jgi:hypothetical protein
MNQPRNLITHAEVPAWLRQLDVAAGLAEHEATALRVELRAAHDCIIRTKAIAWRVSLANLLFYAVELHRRDGMSDAELIEDVAAIGMIGMSLASECSRYRRRWGAASVEEHAGGIRDAKALLGRLLTQVRKTGAHRRHKLAGHPPSCVVAAMQRAKQPVFEE